MQGFRQQISELKYIQQLYNSSFRKRDVDPEYQRPIREFENKNQMFKHYAVFNSQEKKKLFQTCQCFMPVRGDGNCFYTALSFQFLVILLIQYNQAEFDNFIKQIQKLDLSFEINYQQFSIPKESQKPLLFEYLQRLEKLTSIVNKEKRFQALFANYQTYEALNDEIDGLFYGLSIIFFRNLANDLVKKSKYYESIFDKETLLEWEMECNSNEVIIKELSEFLRINIRLMFIEQGTVNQLEYGEEFFLSPIQLLITPGHYNIGSTEHYWQLANQQS